MKKKYLQVLREMKSLFSDSESQEAISFLMDKVDHHDWPVIERQETTPGGFPLPNEIKDFQRALVVFSDGACRGNPGPGAWGAMAQTQSGEVIFEASGVEMKTTNNRMELEGAINGLIQSYEFLIENEIEVASTPVFVYSDSRYVVDGIEKWITGWKARGWRKADNKAPENVELWQKLDHITESFNNLKFIWVKGHAGHPQNEYCDRLANLALDEAGL